MGFGKIWQQGIEKETGEEQEIAGAHIDVADGALELRILCIASSAGIELERISAVSLQHNNDKENSNTGGCGKQNGFQVNTGKEKANKEGISQKDKVALDVLEMQLEDSFDTMYTEYDGQIEKKKKA